MVICLRLLLLHDLLVIFFSLTDNLYRWAQPLDRCPWVLRKVCSHFIPSYNKVSHDVYSSCCGQVCSKDKSCDHCADWSDEKLERVKTYLGKLTAQALEEEGGVHSPLTDGLHGWGSRRDVAVPYESS